MKKLMEYKIISGRTVEIRRVMLEPGRRKSTRRGMRVKGKTSLRKIQRNEVEAVKNLARIINCNYGRGDLWVTLTYDEQHLPEDLKAAKADASRFIRNLRAAYKAETGKKLKYICSSSQKDSRTGGGVRLHHHLILPEDAEGMIYELWNSRDDVTIRHLDGRGDYTGVARYIVSNTDTGETGGAKRWTCSKGMTQPEYTEPVPCKIEDRVRVPRDCSLKANEKIIDEETGIASLYVRYTRAVAPEGGYVDIRRRC